MELVQRLEAIEEIKQVKARYFRYLDTKDWDAFADVFAPEARMDMSGELRGSEPDDGVTTGQHAIAAFVRRMVGDVTTVHHGHTPEIEVTFSWMVLLARRSILSSHSSSRAMLSSGVLIQCPQKGEF